jgi:ribulose-5-phosphate 4-epimerase/fuculose-1-phosphate aldolase
MLGEPEEPTMNDLDFHIGQLVIANRILANEGVVDAYGHVSMRHPRHAERYLLACSRSPELVERTDIMEFTLDGNPVGDDKRTLYLERFIHGAIYEARPDVGAVVHAHAEDVLPFTITTTPAMCRCGTSPTRLGIRLTSW